MSDKEYALTIKENDSGADVGALAQIFCSGVATQIAQSGVVGKNATIIIKLQIREN